MNILKDKYNTYVFLLQRNIARTAGKKCKCDRHGGNLHYHISHTRTLPSSCTYTSPSGTVEQWDATTIGAQCENRDENQLVRFESLHDPL